MAEKIANVMTADPRTVQTTDAIQDAARQMRDGDVGALVVLDGNNVTAIVTDRDIVVRGVAVGREGSAEVQEVCTTGVQTVDPAQDVEDALRIMRDSDVRRLPVVENGRPVGIVSLGDLAVDRDPESLLADISAASPNN